MNTDNSLEEAGQHFPVPRALVCRIGLKPPRKLKHPGRSRKLRSFLDQLRSFLDQ